MTVPSELLPVIQITLPVVAAIFGASWIQNKRLDDVLAHLTEIYNRLGAIEGALIHLAGRVRLEEAPIIDAPVNPIKARIDAPAYPVRDIKTPLDYIIQHEGRIARLEERTK